MIYMQVYGTIDAREKCHDIVDPANSKHNEMFAGQTQKGAHYSFLVKSKIVFSLSGGKPWGPNTNKCKPPIDFSTLGE